MPDRGANLKFPWTIQLEGALVGDISVLSIRTGVYRVISYFVGNACFLKYSWVISIFDRTRSEDILIAKYNRSYSSKSHLQKLSFAGHIYHGYYYYCCIF